MDRAFWRDYLQDHLPLLEVPPDHPRPPRRAGRSARQSRRLPAPIVDQVRTLARAEAVTPFDVFLGAFAVFLYRHTAATDIAVGVAVSTGSATSSDRRHDARVSDIVIRTRCAGAQTFRTLVRATRERAAAALAHATLPLDRVIDLVGAERDPSYHPLVQISFVYDGATGSDARAAASEATGVAVPPTTTPFDLTCSVTEREGVCDSALQYDPALYDAHTIGGLLERWERLLAAMTSQPDRRIGEYDLLSAEERHRQIVEWNSTSTTWTGSSSVSDAIASAAARAPDAVAVSGDGNQHLTYGGLAAASRALSARLRDAGVTSDSLVGVLMDRSIELVVAIGGILEAGGAYVPLDPAAPIERLARLLRTSDLAGIVTTDAARAKVPDTSPPVIVLDTPAPATMPAPVRPTPPPLRDGDLLCYVLYTSGTTGEPKGVAVTHAAVTNLLYDFQRACEVTPADAVLGLAPITFDIASLELLLPLISGARLVLAPAHTVADAEDLQARLVTDQVSILQATPVTWRLLANGGWKPQAGLTLLCGSEPLPGELARQLIETAGHVWNCYGPTETTIYSTFERLQSVDQPITIGGPMANTSIYMLDRRLQPVPIGIAGELYLAGVGLARGYLGQPALTASSFTPDPFGTLPGQRMYASGDLARYRADGRIDCRGRRDHQVKLHGRRIELAAISHVLDAHPLVQSSVTVVCEDARRGRFIASYVTSRHPDRLSRAELRDHVARQLPFYMIPSAIVVIESLPRTRRAKLDRRALPAPTEADFRTTSLVSARTASEAAVAAAWCEVLGTASVGVDDNFFALGGNSLLAARALRLLRDRLDVSLSITCFFEEPTMAGLAQRIDDASGHGSPSPHDAVPRIPHDGRFSLTPQQEEWWRLEHLTGNINPNNVHFILRMAGPLQTSAYVQAFAALTQRHDALRTTFAVGSDGRGVAVIAPPGGDDDLQVRRIDLSGVTATAQEQVLRRLSARERNQAFDLTRGPLWRLTLARLGPEEHVLLLTSQHLVSDARSDEVLMTELSTVYAGYVAGSPVRLPDRPFEFADFVRWQQQWLTSPPATEHLSYWRRQLAPPWPDLFPPSRSDDGYDGHYFSIRRRVPWRLRAETLDFARQSGYTRFSVLTAALTLVLFADTAQPDVRVGTLVPNRDLPGSEHVMGLFVNAVCLRTRVDTAMTFRELVRCVYETIGSATAHQRVPFETLARSLADECPSGLLFQVLTIWLARPSTPWTLPGTALTIDRCQPDEASMVMVRNTLQLRIELVETDTDVRGSITYSPARFPDGAIDAFASAVERCLTIASGEPAITVEVLCQRLSATPASPRASPAVARYTGYAG